MDTKPYLLFSLNDSHYGIDANIVQEIFYLPELIALAETPHDVVGILNLRSQIVPVMHLSLRLGLPLTECEIDDYVIILKWQELLIGIIVNQVQEVKEIESQAITNKIDYGRVKQIKLPFITGIAQVEQQEIILLNHENLVRYHDEVHDSIAAVEEIINIGSEANLNQLNISNFYSLCLPNATPEIKSILRERAKNLRHSLIDFNKNKLSSIAVISLNQEYFGISLDLIEEFTELLHYTPIPCCPNHIVGNMNLRGKIITLIDISQFLNLGNSSDTSRKKVAIVKLKDFVTGIVIDEVVDVTCFKDKETKQELEEKNKHQYLQATILSEEKMIGILDIKKLIEQPNLIVNYNEQIAC
ncbi:CheW protein [Stanieria cyanosphaera PCC 7437]|uniref:CheW protein n=1 Tax=Stanieria cyanosphaera (strain ATCC 29371 / PCC 7437) TaxID=111780 RepID=K9XSI1_STAC7|nr:chemotaxis protein CheW [Stanieria cyanosphaera]AFZ34617.1 CheW protein [Stanieria cyanosphaera PCC 7437]